VILDRLESHDDGLPMSRPNVLFFHVDTVGFGELRCYSGAPLRGATAARIDRVVESASGSPSRQ
jgi:arylsulfatase A-like enzyme